MTSATENSDKQEVSYRWVDNSTISQEDWDKVESILASRGWMSLNRNTPIRILIAEQGRKMAFFIFQWLPYCGPMFVPPSLRGTGVAKELATKMVEFLLESQARGWVATAESEHAAKLCEKFGMSLLETPVYVMPSPGGIKL
jgi:hypothetical protein